MKYTTIQFGYDLKSLLKYTQDISEIGRSIFKLADDHITDIDSKVYTIAITLGTMELGPEFAYSMEELHQIADDLIAGREVKLD